MNNLGYPAVSEQRNNANAAMSSGFPTRLTGCWSASDPPMFDPMVSIQLGEINEDTDHMILCFQRHDRFFPCEHSS